MEDGMLKAQSKVVDIMCNLELIYPPAFFDIMIHLVIYLPLEDLEGGPIHPRWMYPFEIFMKKLKIYVRNKAKPEGSIAEGYVAEEALTFSSYYFRDVTTKFNRPDHNVDCPPPTYQYVLHNSPEIDTYRAKFKSEFPNQDMKEEFSGWFGSQIRQRHIDKDPGVSASSKLFALACGPTQTPISVNSCVVNGVSLNDLEIAFLHIDGQSINVDAPPDIINVDEDDDIIDDEDVLPHDLADSDDEDLINVDDDDGVAMLADITRSHGGDDDNDDRPLHISKGARKPNLGGRKAGMMHTRKKTKNLGLRKITNELGPQPIQFKWKDNDMMLPLGDHSAHWANLLWEIVREFPMHFGSWRSIPAERKARVSKRLGKGIDQHLGKIYTDNKSLLKRDYWVKNPDDETYDVEAIRSRRPANISAEDWDEQIRFWSDPKNMARCAQNARNRAKSTVMQSSATQEYPSLIQTFFDTHTVGGVFLRDEDRRLYEEMLRLQGLGTYIDDQIMAMVRGGKQRGHILGVAQKSNKQLQKQIDMITKAMSSDDRYSQLFTQLQSQHESGSGSGSGASGDDDEDADEDEEDADS
ncbi:DIE2/ALG10 family protein [Tanacetum coccineum]